MAETRKITKLDYRLGRNIRKFRLNKGLTQEKLADAVRVSTTWIGYIETGYRKPNLKLLHKIANVLDVKVKDIIPF